jgi:hypothetical protein
MATPPSTQFASQLPPPFAQFPEPTLLPTLQAAPEYPVLQLPEACVEPVEQAADTSRLGPKSMSLGRSYVDFFDMDCLKYTF